MPDPSQAADLAEFIGLLGELRTWAGSPSYRSLAKQVGAALRPARTVSPFTVVDAFKVGRRRLDLDLVVAIVRALGADGPTVDRWRDACIQVHRLAKTGGPVGVFGQLPTDLATFTGRTQELDQLVATATHPREGDGAGANTVVISSVEGMAGIGKTQLAIHAAHQLVRAGRFTDIQLHVNLRGFDSEHPPADPSAVLEAFLRQLGVAAQQIPASRDERAAMFRDRLCDRSALVLLDNAADEDQVCDLIPASAGSLVLITSRRSLAGLDGVTPHLIGVFSPAESLDLLVRIAGRDRVAAEPEAAVRIVDYCDHLPLAVALTAARLRSRPAWSLAALADQLEAGRLDAIRAGGRAIRPVLDLSYRALPASARRVFRLLGMHPGPDLNADAAAALVARPLAETTQTLELLLDENMLQQRRPGRYELHDLLRAYALELAQVEPEPDPHAPMGRLVSYFEAAGRRTDQLFAHQRIPFPAPAPTSTTDLPDRSAALAWMRAEQESIFAVLSSAQGTHPARCLALALAMNAFIQQNGPWHRGVELQRGMVTLARRTGDTLSVANALWSLGHLQYATNDYWPAAEHLREAAAAYQQAGERLGEANALWGLGRAMQFTAGLRESAAQYEQALTLYRELGEHASEANVLHDLARVRYLSGDLSAAVSLQYGALDGYRRTSNRLGEANALIGLARLRQTEGQLPLAATLFDLAKDIYNEIGSLLGHANAVAGTARVRHSQGQIEHATHLYATALTQYRDIGARQGEANTVYDLARARHELGETVAAAELYRQAEDLFTELGDAHGTAQALNSLGFLHASTGSPDHALPLHERALALARKANTPNEETRAQKGIMQALAHS